MPMHRIASRILTVALFACLLAPNRTFGQTTAQLELQTSALATLGDLQPTLEQLVQMQKLAAGAVDPTYIAPDEATGANPYHDALIALRDALVAGDAAKITQARADAAGAKAKGGSASPNVTVSSDARKSAPAILEMLDASQYAKFISSHVNEIDDAGNLLAKAVDKTRGLTETEFVALRDGTANEINIMVWNADPGQHPVYTQHINELLNKAHRMKDDEFQAERADLIKSAHKTLPARQTHAETEVQNWFNGQMAKLLSNPEVNTALALKIKAVKNEKP